MTGQRSGHRGGAQHGLARSQGVRVDFDKESLVFTGEDSPTVTLMLSVMGAFAEFERSLIRNRQRQGIALAKQRGAYKGQEEDPDAGAGGRAGPARRQRCSESRSYS